MKKSVKIGLAGLVVLVLAAVVAVGLLSRTYFQFISRKIYGESTSLLSEVYTQVNGKLSDFMNKSWGTLGDWSYFLREAEEEEVRRYLEERRAYWHFSCFYFLAEDGSYRTQDGAAGRLDLGEEGARVFEKGEQGMLSCVLPDGQAIVLFAIPVLEGSFQGFSYRGIAVSYNNADIVSVLSAQAFSGQSKSFLIKSDGSVLFSTQPGGSVFSNYLMYLRAGSDLDAAALEQMQADWHSGAEGILRPVIGEVRHYLVYQPVGYENLILLGLVPERAVSTSFQEIQGATLQIVSAIFLIVGLSVFAVVVYRYRMANRKSAIALRYRKLMFDTLSRSVDEIFLMLDSNDWKVDYISPNVERLLGIPFQEAQEDVHSLAECAVDGAVFTAEQLKDIPLFDSCRYECQCERRGGQERRWYVTSIYHEKIKDTEKYIVVMSDRTQEKALTRNLETALEIADNANKAKSDFLSNMSHDIRTPMNAIIGFNALLARHTDDADRVREYTGKIASASQHLLYLINDILDMSRIESGKASLNIAQFSLPQLMEELYEMLLSQAKAKGQKFEIRVQGHPAEALLGDKLKLNQILINLLGNAIKYTPEGGHIDFQVIELPRQSTQFARVRFVISDDGIGMSERFLARIFDTFSREENSTTSGIQGTGLGMAITKRLVDLMGGTIDARSVQGQGSTFTVDLSFSLPEAEEDTQFWSHHGISRILVADDEEDICLGIREMMDEVGVEVSYATSGQQALAMAREAEEKGQGFRAVLLDWKMPGWPAVESVKRLRELLGEGVPVLILTAYDWIDIEEEARIAGITAFLPKPFFVSTFRRVLEQVEAGASLADDPDVFFGAGASLRGMKFLVAEDNEINSEILGEMLHAAGAEYTLALNGQEALDKFLASGEGDYDMIFMDVQMPVMNGYDATRAIRASGHPLAGTIPIIAMTANAFAEDVRNALESGMNEHLAKPIDMEAAVALIKRIRKDSRKQRTEEVT